MGLLIRYIVRVRSVMYMDSPCEHVVSERSKQHSFRMRLTCRVGIPGLFGKRWAVSVTGMFTGAVADFYMWNSGWFGLIQPVKVVSGVPLGCFQMLQIWN